MIIERDELITQENANKIFSVVQIINSKGIKYYDKNWRKVHKELKLPQNKKMKFIDYCTNSQMMTQPKDKRRKPVPKLTYATIDYDNIKYYLSYNKRAGEYEVSSYYDTYDHKKFVMKDEGGNIILIHKEQKKEIKIYDSIF